MSLEHAPAREAGKAERASKAEPPNPDALAWSIGNFAKLIDVGRSFIYQEIKAGNLVANKAGDRTLITNPNGKKYIENLPRLIPKAERSGPKTT